MSVSTRRSPLWTKSLHSAIFDSSATVSSVSSPPTSTDAYVTAFRSMSSSYEESDAVTVWRHSHDNARRILGEAPPQASTPTMLTTSSQPYANSSLSLTNNRRSLGSEMGLTPREDDSTSSLRRERQLQADLSLSSEEHTQNEADSDRSSRSSHPSIDSDQAARQARAPFAEVSYDEEAGLSRDSSSIRWRPPPLQPAPVSDERRIVLIEMDEETSSSYRIIDEVDEHDVLAYELMALDGVQQTASYDVDNQHRSLHSGDGTHASSQQQADEQQMTVLHYTQYEHDVANYLEPVEEVTEEPTMAYSDTESTCTIDQQSFYKHRQDRSGDASATSSQATSTARASTLLQSPVRLSSNVASAPRDSINTHDWEQLHGLGTPSSVSSSRSRFGWAEVIASARPALRPTVPRRSDSLALLSKGNGGAPSSSSVSLASSVCSPARLIGLRDSFWLTSPANVTLGQSLLHAAEQGRRQQQLRDSGLLLHRSTIAPLMQRTRDMDNVRLSIESARSPGDDGWAYVTVAARGASTTAATAPSSSDIDDSFERPHAPRLSNGKRWKQSWSKLAGVSSTLSSMRSHR